MERFWWFPSATRLKPFHESTTVVAEAESHVHHLKVFPLGFAHKFCGWRLTALWDLSNGMETWGEVKRKNLCNHRLPTGKTFWNYFVEASAWFSEALNIKLWGFPRLWEAIKANRMVISGKPENLISRQRKLKAEKLYNNKIKLHDGSDDKKWNEGKTVTHEVSTKAAALQSWRSHKNATTMDAKFSSAASQGNNFV